MDDKEIEEVLLNLGLKISEPPQAQEKFHILATSPQNFPILEIIRPQDSSRFHLRVMGTGIAPEHKMGLDIAILPPF
jgi:hypothetical protein